MPSQWADYGFPDVKFKTLEKLNAALTRAWEERNYWSRLFDSNYHNIDFTKSINDYIPEFHDTLGRYARDFIAEETVYDGLQEILGYRIGPYNVYGSYGYGTPLGIIGATNEYPGYSGTRHYFVGNFSGTLYPESVISRFPIGREDAFVSEYSGLLGQFVKDYNEQFFSDFCHHLGEDSRFFLKFIPLQTLYRKMYEYVNERHYLRFRLDSRSAYSKGGAIKLSPAALDFFGDSNAFWLFGERDNGHYLYYKTVADDSFVTRSYLIDELGAAAVYLDLDSVLQFYDPPQE